MDILTVVNQMIGTLGEQPLTSLTDSHEYLGTAQDTLDRVSRAIQAKGAWYNMESVKLDPNPVDKAIYLPGDVLEVVAVNRNYIQRGNRLYNLDGGGYEFDKSQELTLIRYVGFEDLPETAAVYIGATAVLDFQSVYDGDSARRQKLAATLADAAIAYNQAHIRNRRVNLIDSNFRLQRLKSVTRGARAVYRP